MQPHEERVAKEKQDLDEKLAKLLAFQEDGIFKSLHADDRDRLERQSAVMKQYSDILGERLAAFPK